MALTAETLTGPDRKTTQVRPFSAERMAKTHCRRDPPLCEDAFSTFYATPLLLFHFALYGAAPFYYLVHYSPFGNQRGGVGDGALDQFARWTLFVMMQYITAVMVVSWSGRYQVQRNTAAFAFMVAGLVLVSGLKAWVDNMDPMGRRG